MRIVGYASFLEEYLVGNVLHYFLAGWESSLYGMRSITWLLGAEIQQLADKLSSAIVEIAVAHAPSFHSCPCSLTFLSCRVSHARNDENHFEIHYVMSRKRNLQQRVCHIIADAPFIHLP